MPSGLCHDNSFYRIGDNNNNTSKDNNTTNNKNNDIWVNDIIMESGSEEVTIRNKMTDYSCEHCVVYTSKPLLLS